jgi:hypothetical protein
MPQGVKIIDEYTDRTDLSAEQKWRLRHPHRTSYRKVDDEYTDRNDLSAQQKWYLRNRAKVRTYSQTRWTKEADTLNAAVRKATVKKNYGLTLEEYDHLRDRPCEICGRAAPEVRIVIDHSVAGSYHGVLCHGCNSSIGHLRHDAEIIERAAEYVRRTREYRLETLGPSPSPSRR